MSKELVKQESKNEVAVVNMNEWGDVQVEAKDFIMPRILLQQAMSEAVKTRIANDGDFLNTLTNTVCSSEKGIVKILPFFCKQSYTVNKKQGNKFVFDRIDPYVEGVRRPWEEVVDGVEYKIVHNYNFFCLLEDGGLPAIVSFGSTSNYTGKRLFNLMYLMNPQQGKTPAHNWIMLGRKQEVSKAGDKYFVMEFDVGPQSTKEELAECLKWIPIIKQSDYKVAEEQPQQAQTEIKETRF